MIKPIGLEDIEFQAPVPGSDAGRTVGQLTDEKKRRLVWFIQSQSHQDGGLKRFAYQLLSGGGGCALGSATMHHLGFNASTIFRGKDYETICDELNFHPLGTTEQLKARRSLLLPHVYRAAADRSLYARDSICAPTAAEIAEETVSNRELLEIESRLDPNRRHYSAVTFLYECRAMALMLPKILHRLCTDPAASWSASFLLNLEEALSACLTGQAQMVKKLAAETRIRSIVEEALNYSYTTRTLGVINGPERFGKSVSAQMWCAANPDKARYVNLTAATTDLLFYGEIFDALGCGEKKTGSANELRSGIRETLKNHDIALVFDEAHCLFGLSEKASIKRLEYIRTEFVNHGIPVVLIITPQFASRLSDLEKKTSFNVNQLRGRISRWTELAQRPDRTDIECICKFCLPGLDKDSCSLLATYAQESEYPFAAVRRAATELAVLIESGKVMKIDAQAVKKAIGYALFTSQQVATTLPQQTGKTRSRATPPQFTNDRAIPLQLTLPVQESGNGVADRLKLSELAPVDDNLSANADRTRNPATLTV